MKTQLPNSIIVSPFKSEKGTAKEAAAITLAENSLKAFSLKTTLLKTALVVFSLLLVNTAFANRWRVSDYNVGNQSATPTYGAPAPNTLSYTITINETNVSGTQGSNKFTITWAAGAAPAGVTTSLDGTGQTYTPSRDNQTVTFTISTTSATPAGGFAFTVHSTETNGGNPPTDNGVLNINKKNLTVTGTVTASDKTYDGTANAAVSGGTLVGKIGADDVSISPVGTFSSPNVGNLKTVTIALTGANASYYTLIQPSVKASITPAALVISAGDVSKVYGTTLNTQTGRTTFTSTGLQNGETIGSVTYSYGTGATAGSAVNTYSNSVTASAATGGTFTASNYTITYPNKGDIIVTPATLIIKANNATSTYGAAALPTFTAVVTTVNGDPQSVVDVSTLTFSTTATAASNAGAYTITVSGGTVLSANYSATITYQTGTLTIGKAALTIDANNVTKIVGTTLTGGTGYTNFTPTGLQNGETVGSVTATFVGTRGDRATDPINTYTNTIQPSAATGGTFLASNYTITYTNGNINVIAATFDWTGAAGSTNWNVAGNWNLNGVPSTTLYPGQSSANDVVRIGVGTAFTNQPEITAILPHSIATLTFGNTTATTLTVDAAATTGLTVTGTLTINANTAVGLVDNGPVSVTGNYSDASTSTLTVNGTKSFTVSINNDVNINGTINQSGSGTVSLSSSNGSNNDVNINGTVNQTAGGALTISSDQDLNVNTNGSVNQAATATGSVTLSSDDDTNISGSLIQNGANAFKATASGNLTVNTSGIVTQNSSIAGSLLSLITINNNGTLQNSGHINLQSAGGVTLTSDGLNENQGNILQSGSGTMTLTGGTGFFFFLQYAGVFNNNTINQTGSGAMIFTTAFHNNVYPNSITPTFTQAGTGSITFNSTFENGLNGIGNGGPVTFGGGTSTVTFKSSFTNTTGTTTFGTGPSFFNSTFTNASNTTGSVTFGTGLATFNSNAGSTFITIQPNTSLTFVNTLFTNHGHFLFKTNTGATGSYIIASNGVMTLSNTTSLDFANSKGITLLSDATGSATIAAIPSDCSISAAGKAFVQRFIKGSADQSKRGYRLITSTVYTATVGGSNVFDLNYLTSTNLSGFGLAANGFNIPSTTNPTIYLFREDDMPPPALATVFTTGYNWKGVAKINNSPLYNIATQTKMQTSNVADTTTTIPVGNGLLYFFRGGGLVNNYTAPFAAPADATLVETGTLNTGTIPVKLWYSNTGNNLGNNFSFTADSAHAASTSSLTSGFTLVGNPYPSTINWEKYNNGGMTGNVTKIIYEFNEFSRQYDAYMALQGADVTSEITAADSLGNTTGSATNFIASGQGFFVLADKAGENLTFNENAKVNTLPLASNFLKFMGKPKATVAAPAPFLHLRMVTDSVNSDDVIIRFNDNSSANYVRGEDAVDLGGSSALESLSVFSADSIKLAISTMPLPGSKPTVVHLFTGSPNPGTYQLNVITLKNLSSLYRVWLKDGFTKDSVDLKKTNSYSFVIDKSNQATFGANRFTLVFSQDTAAAYHLLNFTAEKMGNDQKVQTVWNTKNEQNYTNFTVERSIDYGKTFDVVGGVKGTGAGTYSLIDKKPVTGDNIYRLKQEDLNNVITYSNLVEVLFGAKKDNVHVYPNPAVNVINIDVTAKWHDNDKYDIVITNSSGAIVRQGTSGDNTWQTGISNLRPGTYLVSVLGKKDKGLVGQSKFVKL